jgi:hypothetical protein
MKKRLEAELISIAHRVLKLKNKSEVDQLYIETRKLYETLTVLKFYGDNFEQINQEISQEEIEEKLAQSVSEEPKQTSVKILAESKSKKEVITEEAVLKKEEPELEEVSEEIVSQVTDEEEQEEENVEKENLKQVQIEEISFDAIFEMASEEIIEDKVAEIEEVEIENPVQISEPKQISFDDLLGENYTEPVFVKPNNTTKSVVEENFNQVEIKEEPKSIILNDKLAKGINIGLNDRVAFVKHLFADSSEDYNRVLSQLNTFDTLDEAENFIEEMVKPDYNNWNSKEEYAERFMEIIAKKFN